MNKVESLKNINRRYAKAYGFFHKTDIGHDYIDLNGHSVDKHTTDSAQSNFNSNSIQTGL